MSFLAILWALVAFAALGGAAGFLAAAINISNAEESVPMPVTAEKPGRRKGKAEEKRRVFAQIHCAALSGEVRETFRYEGFRDCRALFRFYGGNLACKYGCLRLGSCIAVCPRRAIRRAAGGLIQVERALCDGCGMCLAACPVGAIRLVSADADFIVACSSRDPVEDKAAYCAVACTVCGLCGNKAPDGGFIADRGLVTIDYLARGERVYAYVGCPTSCIRPADDLRKKFDKEFAES